MGDRDRLNGVVCASIVALWRDRRVEIGAFCGSVFLAETHLRYCHMYEYFQCRYAGKIVFLFMCLEYSQRKDMMCEEAISFVLRCLEYFQWKDEIC